MLNTEALFNAFLIGNVGKGCDDGMGSGGLLPHQRLGMDREPSQPAFADTYPRMMAAHA